MEGIRIAMEMERRGHQMYSRALSFAKDPQVRTLLTQLIQEEAEHFAYFSKLQSQMELSDSFDSTDPAPSPHLAASMAAEAFYPGGLMQAAMSNGFSSIHSLLEVASKAEEDSITYYKKLQATLSGSQFDALEKIIREEERHHVLLLNRLEDVR